MDKQNTGKLSSEIPVPKKKCGRPPKQQTTILDLSSSEKNKKNVERLTDTPVSDNTASVNKLKPNRTRLDEKESLILVRLCIENAEDYYHGNFRTFWTNISNLLQEATGKAIKDPQSTMKTLMANRNVRNSI